MRTTVTLDADTDAIVRRFMRERSLTFKQAVNEAIRAGVTRPRGRAARTPTFDLGAPRVSLDRALRLAADMEDDEIRRELDRRK
jgi:hypothetical protein